MLKQLERRNREIWSGRSTILQDAAHVAGGVGLGLLLYPALLRSSRSLGWALIMLSAAAHVYGDLTRGDASLRDR